MKKLSTKSPLFGFGVTCIVVTPFTTGMPLHTSTTTFCVAESLHPFTSVNVYTTGYVPAPTADASKLFPLTPGPEYVPPAGEPPDNAVGPSMSQNVSVARTTVTVGNAFTVTLTVDVFTHPFASVPVTVYVVEPTGTSITDDPESDPGIQLYVAAPEPVSVTASPSQIADEEAEAATEGSAFTFTITVDVFEQPLPSVPVTVYVVFAFGATFTDTVENDPGIQLYVDAPDAESVVESPSQMVFNVAEAATAGSEFTVTITVDVSVQPLPSVPVTVYVVFAFGVTGTEVPLSDPGIQLYVDAPEPVSVVVLPSQIVDNDADAATVGSVLTTTATVDVFVQPLTSVPVTVYVVLAFGVTGTEVPLSDPGIQLYVDAPPPVSVVELPSQIVDNDADAVTVGSVFTVTVIVAVFEHPGPFVPVTV